MFHMIFHQIVHIISFNNNYALTRHLFKKKKPHLFYLKNKKKNAQRRFKIRRNPIFYQQRKNRLKKNAITLKLVFSIFQIFFHPSPQKKTSR